LQLKTLQSYVVRAGYFYQYTSVSGKISTIYTVPAAVSGLTLQLAGATNLFLGAVAVAVMTTLAF